MRKAKVNLKGLFNESPFDLHGKAIMEILAMITNLDRRVMELEKGIDANRTHSILTES